MDIVIFTVPAALAISNSSGSDYGYGYDLAVFTGAAQMHLLYDEIFFLPALLSYTKNGQK